MLRITTAPKLAHTLSHGSVWGYVGARDKQICKYASVLSSFVPLVLRDTAPLKDCFFARSKLRVLAERWLLELAKEAPSHPGVVWILSNGGAFVYEKAVLLLREDAALPPAQQRFARVSFSHIVYDSAPVWVTPQATANALTTGLGYSRHPLGGAVNMGLYLFFSAAMGLSRETPDELFASLAADMHTPLPPRAAPARLLVYSADDAITRADKVEEFAARCAEGGGRVVLWKVPSPSAHCTHLLTHREAYLGHLRAFLEAPT
jgi:hypothetical protein